MNERELKAVLIAAKSKLVRHGKMWYVPSQQSTSRQYKVDLSTDMPQCTCPDFELRRQPCKHMLAVQIVATREQTVVEQGTDGEIITTTTTETVRVTYSQNWTAYNQAQTNEQDLFQRLLHDLCSGIQEPARTTGRPRLSYRDMIFAVTFKVFSTFSGRRFMSDLRDAQEKDYIEKVPHFNSIFNYLELPALTPVLRELITFSSLPLKSLESDFAIDSSGFSTGQYARWFNAKYGREVDVQQWLKVHLMCGVKTNVVTSVEITGQYDNDSPQLPSLVEHTAANFNVKEVSADKAYSGTENHEAIAKAGATPYIAFKRNATGGAGGTFEKMFHLYSVNRETFLGKYHKRSNVESTFNMIKAKFGGRLRSKGRTAQVNEALCKILCHNLVVLIQSMFEFGIEPLFSSHAE